MVDMAKVGANARSWWIWLGLGRMLGVGGYG